MANLLHLSETRSWTFDFSKRRTIEYMIDERGKHRNTMSKFDMGYTLCACGGKYFYIGLLAEDGTYSYEEAKQYLMEALEAKQFDNVTIIR